MRSNDGLTQHQVDRYLRALDNHRDAVGNLAMAQSKIEPARGSLSLNRSELAREFAMHAGLQVIFDGKHAKEVLYKGLTALFTDLLRLSERREDGVTLSIEPCEMVGAFGVAHRVAHEEHRAIEEEGKEAATDEEG